MYLFKRKNKCGAIRWKRKLQKFVEISIVEAELKALEEVNMEAVNNMKEMTTYIEQPCSCL